MFNRKNRKELEEELNQAKRSALYYKSKYLLIEQLLRAQKETDGNVFTLVRKIRDIVYTDALPK